MRDRRRPGWRGILSGNVVWLSVASFLNDASSEMIFPLLPLFLVGTLGAGPAFLGLVEGVAETTAAFTKLAGGWLADRGGLRRPFVAWGYGLAAGVRPLLAAASLPWHVLAVRFGDRVGKGLRTAPRDALLAESVGARERSRAFGVHRAADHAGAILGPLLATGLLLLWPGRLRLVFLLAVLPAALAVIAVLVGVREAPAARGQDATAQPAPAPPRAVSPAPRPLTRYLAVLVLFTLGNASDAFLLLRAQELGVAIALIPVLWVALHLSKAACSVAGGALADAVGPRPAIVAGWLAYAAVYAGFAGATERWQVWALFVVYGVYYGLTEPSEKALVASLAAPGGRARAFGIYHFAVGIAALPASLVFGAIWSAWSAPAAFLVGAALALVASLLLPLAVPGRARAAM